MSNLPFKNQKVYISACKPIIGRPKGPSFLVRGRNTKTAQSSEVSGLSELVQLAVENDCVLLPLSRNRHAWTDRPLQSAQWLDIQGQWLEAVAKNPKKVDSLRFFTVQSRSYGGVEYTVDEAYAQDFDERVAKEAAQTAAKKAARKKPPAKVAAKKPAAKASPKPRTRKAS